MERIRVAERQRIMKRALALSAMVLLLAACGSDGDSEDAGAGGDGGAASGVDGAWTLESGTVDGEPIPLSADYPVTLVIEGDQFSGRAACNSYGGSGSIDGDSFKIGDVAWTEMGCEPQVMETEQAYLAALMVVDEVALEGDALTLTGGGAELRFSRDAPIQDAALVGVVWTLDTLIEGEAASTTLGETATLKLASDGTIVATTGCRELTGEYVINGSEVAVTSASMAGECPQDLARQDNLVVTVLTDGFTVEIEGQRLILTSMGGDGLSYTSEVEG
jgi:heat shock protein HslJ